MVGLSLRRFIAAAAGALLALVLLAALPALVVPGAAVRTPSILNPPLPGSPMASTVSHRNCCWQGPAITIMLLVLLSLAMTVPNLLVHLTRRLTIRHCGATRVVWFSITTGDARLRARICAAFPDIVPSQIEGLEHPRGSGVVYPISLVAAAVDSLLGSDCEVALLRPEPGQATRFLWSDLQPPPSSSEQPPPLTDLQRDFSRCLAAKGYCLIKMPPELLTAPAGVFAQGKEFFARPVSEKAGYRQGTKRDELRHGWFAEANRQYFEVHRSIGSTDESLPFPDPQNEGLCAAAVATFDMCEGVAHRALELLL